MSGLDTALCVIGIVLIVTGWAFAPKPKDPRRRPLREDFPDEVFPNARPMRQRARVGPGWRKTDAPAPVLDALPPLNPLDQYRLHAEIRTLTLDREDQATCPSSQANAKGLT